MKTERGNTVVTVERDKMAVEGSRKKLLLCAAGIFFCYFYYGILQEKITRGKYGEGENAEKFTYTLALVFIQCIINALFAKTMLTVSPPGPDSTPVWLYVTMTLSYLGAMLASNHSLQFINYPTQVLGKSVKPIPVMILGVLIAKKRYPLQKYLFVMMIVAGVALFMFKDKAPAKGAADHAYGMGELLLLLSLTLDGLTGATQDKMRGEHSTKTHHLMFNVNFWSVIFLAVGLLLTGEGFEFIGFVQRHPMVLVYMLTFSGASALGQNFIFMTVTNFGPLTCSIITTTRKFFTILASVFIFGNPMIMRQWIGTILVFIGLSLDSAYGKSKQKK